MVFIGRENAFNTELKKVIKNPPKIIAFIFYSWISAAFSLKLTYNKQAKRGHPFLCWSEPVGYFL